MVKQNEIQNRKTNVDQLLSKHIYIYVCYILQDLNYTVAKMLYGVLFRRPKSVLLLFVHLCFHNNSYLLFKILETVF